MFDPDAVVRADPRIIIKYESLPGSMRGCTDGRAIIWIDRSLTETERRCTLTHELVHLYYGHEEPPGVKGESRVRRETAHLLIPDDALEDALRWSTDVHELADLLCVTVPVMKDRLRGVGLCV